MREASQPALFTLGTFFSPVCRYAMERTTGFIKIWFWSRDSKVVPSDVSNDGSGLINTDAWGIPIAHFPNTNCDIDEKFDSLNIVISLTFCGFSLLRIGYR